MLRSIIDIFSLYFDDKNKFSSGTRVIINEYNKTREGKNHNFFCYAPSVNMLFSQNGNVNVCCHNEKFPIGKYPEQSIKEIWNSAKANELRELMKKYDLSKGCEVCEFDLNMKSYGEVRARHFDTLPKHPKYPTMMEFLLSNTCNLECVMCKGEFSSLIRKNREKLAPINSPFDNEFLLQLQEFIPYLREVRFSGSGEAFSIDMNYKIWDMIIKRNPKCLIMVQTNGTILTDRVKEILDKGNFQIGVSLDSLKKETFENIRVNANFDKVMSNLNYFYNYSKNRNNKFSISTCVMRQNWMELPDFINLCNKLDIIATFHKVWYPLEYAIHNLPAKELEEIHKYLSAYDFPAQTIRQIKNREHYHYFVSVINKWKNEPRKISERAVKVKMLSKEELMPFLIKSLNTYYYQAEMTAKANQQALTEIAINKINNFIEQIDDDNHKEMVLRMMCSEETEAVMKMLVKHNNEYLIELAKKYIKIMDNENV